MKVDNLFMHADGDLYCLLNGDTSLKEPTPVGLWHDAVIYMGTDMLMRSTLRSRWDERFSPVAEYHGSDEAVLRMIRRANPGAIDLDFVRTFEAWHESEIGITGHMLELAVAAAIERFVWEHDPLHTPAKVFVGGHTGDPVEVAMVISTADLQRIVQNYEIERVPEPHGFRFVMRKSFPDEG